MAKFIVLAYRYWEPKPRLLPLWNSSRNSFPRVVIAMVGVIVAMNIEIMDIVIKVYASILFFSVPVFFVDVRFLVVNFLSP